MSEHTPGPWAVDTRWDGLRVVPEADLDKKRGGTVDPERDKEFQRTICECRGSRYEKYAESRVMLEEGRANARFIAAAPRVVEAAMDLVGQISRKDRVSSPMGDYYEPHLTQGVVDELREAIYEARGDPDA